MRALMTTVHGMLERGESPDAFLPPEKGQRIEERMRARAFEDAERLIDEALREARAQGVRIEGDP